MLTKTEKANTPDHIPENLVHQWQETDFPEFETKPYEVWHKLAKGYPPIFWTPEHYRSDNGAWIVTNAQYCREVLQNADPLCTSIRYSSDDAAWPRRLVPLMMDPPEHLKYRALIAPLFSPKQIDKMEAQVTDVANELIDGFAKKGHVEFMSEFSRVFPGIIFMNLMGLPLEMKDQFFFWEEKFFHDGTDEEKKQVGLEIHQYLTTLIEEKRRNPADDIISMLLKTEIDDKPLDNITVQDFCFFLYIAGLDTVNGALGHTFKYLAENPVEQQRLRENPELVIDALEEILRIHTWVNTSRVLSRDYEFHGIQMKAGERVMVMTSASSWDPELIEDPDKVDLTREVNPHLAFGGGVHRCAGSHLARREIRVAINEWLRRIPSFEITPGEEVPYFTDGLLSPRVLPLSWDCSKAI